MTSKIKNCIPKFKEQREFGIRITNEGVTAYDIILSSIEGKKITTMIEEYKKIRTATNPQQKPNYSEVLTNFVVM